MTASSMQLNRETLPLEEDELARLSRKAPTEIIHSGHFMVSDIDDADNTDEVARASESDCATEVPGSLAAPLAEAVEEISFDPDEEMEVDKHLKPPCHIAIDGSLTKLFECMTLAYRPLSWRASTGSATSTISPPSTRSGECSSAKRTRGLGLGDDSSTNPVDLDLRWLSHGGLIDEDFFMDLSESLFSSLNQPFDFPNPREIATRAGIADFIQPGLIQLQPAFEDFMDTLEPLSDYFNSKLPTLPEEGSLSAEATTVQPFGIQQQQRPASVFGASSRQQAGVANHQLQPPPTPATVQPQAPQQFAADAAAAGPGFSLCSHTVTSAVSSSSSSEQHRGTPSVGCTAAAAAAAFATSRWVG
ncbi:hypothetical protein HPB51_009175 [Rhipicephalus microplus]|uniref:Uncharacterized protein n=1 Tax=Rhipicephalus microplus TaxID=6941 RepID=A0A9J6F0A1_RHIMP|nr:hypothetical protein HPB51_009175 [Rhipicephalus microplus]